MTPADRRPRRPRGRVPPASLVLLPALLAAVRAQHCADTCPPLNDLGLPIPSLCVGDATPDFDAGKDHEPCSGTLPDAAPAFSLDDFRGPGRATVVSNYYFGCNAGRREAGVFAHAAQRLHDEHPDRVVFVASNKGASCGRWSATMRNDARSYYPDYPRPDSMPVVVDDHDFEIRDLYFTPPFGHPSYVVLDGDLNLRHKFIGPCCGKSSFWDCSLDEAKTLNDQLTAMVEQLLEEQSFGDVPTPSPSSERMEPTGQPTESEGECAVGDWSEWSACSVTCGDSGLQFRWRVVVDHRVSTDEDDDGAEPLSPCPSFFETKPCGSTNPTCDTVCTLEVGEAYTIDTVAGEFSSPRDVAFHPTPGLHLSTYAEGRRFPAGNLGHGEAWVLNGGNHSVSIVSAVGTVNQTTLSRRDRGYYHYMIDATAFSFNSVADSGRNPDRDGFNYWAVCNDNRNTYLDTKEPNNFMGPTLYDSKPGGRNTVNHLGEDCKEYEQCHFMHADMLHESPACIGLVHDPERKTAHGHVYWAFDTTGNGTQGQLVRFDFQQPHGPGSMDHSIAAVRRYPGVALTRGPGKGGHAGMVVHSVRREVYIANPGEGTVVVVGADTGSYARIAREEYPIFSNRLPSFDYSIWECAEQRIFASGIDTPSGLALSKDEKRLYVAERGTGNILVYEVSSATLLNVIETEYVSIGGMAISPNTDTLFFVDEDTKTLNFIHRSVECTDIYSTRTSEDFVAAVDSAAIAFSQSTPPQTFSLYHDASCIVTTIVPNVTYFEQVHNDTGYAGNHTEGTLELAERTDCGYDSDLNFDALLLGGYYCHVCLPENHGAGCDKGGVCQNVQWQGYVCDNHYQVVADAQLTVKTSLGEEVSASILIDPDTVYRFTVSGEEAVYLSEDESGMTILKYPEDDDDAPLEAYKGEMTFDPSRFPEESRPLVIYLHLSAAISPTDSPSAAPSEKLVDDVEYYVVCGKGSGCSEGDESVAVSSQANEVRCCRDESGFEFNQKRKFCDVWTRSDFSGCHDVAYATAKGICEDNHGRLCTRDELADGCTKGSGCSFDHQLIWSSTLVVSGTNNPSPSTAPTEEVIADAEYFVVCGKGSGCDEGDQIVAVSSQAHEVRCCRDEPGFGFTTKKYACDVWAQSDFLGCHETSYPLAKGICEDNQGRLCTKDELTARCTKGSGCGFDNHLTWSSTAAKYYVVWGKGSGCDEGNEGVAAPSQTHEVRCCRDESGFDFTTKRDNCDVWSRSDFDGCHETTYAGAKAICEDNQGRLCTKDELTARCTKGSGCGFDHNLIWSSTED